MQIVSSKTNFDINAMYNKIIEPKYNQNWIDRNTSVSSISTSTNVPGMNIRILINTHMVIKHVINIDFRHLYLSVKPPTAGVSNPVMGSIVNIQPTTTDEYPRCFDMVDRKGRIDAQPDIKIRIMKKKTYIYIYTIINVG